MFQPPDQMPSQYTGESNMTACILLLDTYDGLRQTYAMMLAEYNGLMGAYNMLISAHNLLTETCAN